MLHYDSLRLRPRGTLAHYMTYSGTLMLVIVRRGGAAGLRRRAIASGRRWSCRRSSSRSRSRFTRNAWVGACVAVGLLFVLKDFRLTGAAAGGRSPLVFALAPDSITNRMMSMFDLQDPTNQDRLAMLRDRRAHGARPSADRRRPEHGAARLRRSIGPTTRCKPVNPHLHNVPLQIAAERGLPALPIWLWFIVALVAGARSGMFRQRQRPRACRPPALAAVAAMLAAGLFDTTSATPSS